MIGVFAFLFFVQVEFEMHISHPIWLELRWEIETRRRDLSVICRNLIVLAMLNDIEWDWGKRRGMGAELWEMLNVSGHDLAEVPTAKTTRTTKELRRNSEVGEPWENSVMEPRKEERRQWWTLSKATGMSRRIRMEKSYWIWLLYNMRA